MSFPSLRLRVIATLLAGLMAGCGYSSGVRLPEGHETVAVEYFGNDSPDPDLERSIHLRLSDQVARMVNAPLVAPQHADLVIQGRIIDYRRLFGIIGGSNNLMESGVQVYLEAWLYDPHRGIRLGRRIRLNREIRYMVRVRGDEPEALEIALETVTQELVLDLFNQEAYEPEELDEIREDSEVPEDRDRLDSPGGIGL